MEHAIVEIVDTGSGEWALAALVTLGRVYEDMAETLTSSERPTHLTSEQLEQYDMMLSDRAYVMTEKAVNTYIIARDRGFELTLYNAHTSVASDRLDALRPDDYPGVHEELRQPHYLAGRRAHRAGFETSLRD